MLTSFVGTDRDNGHVQGARSLSTEGRIVFCASAIEPAAVEEDHDRAGFALPATVEKTQGNRPGRGLGNTRPVDGEFAHRDIKCVTEC